MAKSAPNAKKGIIKEIGLPMTILLVMVPLYYFAPIFDHRTDDGICKWRIFDDLPQ